ncbi:MULTISPECIES: acyltransferase [unclassified Ralstonia]|uniref:acyltransferase n=1 Tax=unclassified Ralstonia TaxID=209769 RepID=UPI002B528AFF|nr:acyltransferase [Ralstonia sp.]HWV07651.1 acyltransferase [Ralstonia sp.]
MAEIKKNGAGTVKIGHGCSIGENVQIIFARPASVTLGDYVTLGDNVKMIVDGGKVEIGDWTTLHADTLVLSKTGVSIGQHCWFGQNTVLDGTGGLTIENGVRVGMYSQLWSHVAAGEQIEGCTLFGERPIHVEPDVWLVGSCIVASGVRIGRRAVALIASNITKDVPAEAVIAGSPAKPKEGLSFYKSVTLDEKFEMLEGWLKNIIGAPVMDAPSLTRDDNMLTVHWDDVEKVIFYKNSTDFDRTVATRPSKVTLCCVEDKRYVKAMTRAERSVLKALAGNKARFYTA